MNAVPVESTDGIARMLIDGHPHMRVCDVVPDLVRAAHPALNPFARDRLPALIQQKFVQENGDICSLAPFRGKQECWFVREADVDKLVDYVADHNTVREANNRFFAFRNAAKQRQAQEVSQTLKAQLKEKPAVTTPGKLTSTVQVVEHRIAGAFQTLKGGLQAVEVDLRLYDAPSFDLPVRTVIYNGRLWASAASLRDTLALNGKPNSHFYSQAETLVVRGGGPGRPSVFVSIDAEDEVQLVMVGKANAPDPNVTHLLRELQAIFGAIAPVPPAEVEEIAAEVAAIPTDVPTVVEEDEKLSSGAQKLFDKVMNKVADRMRALEFENQMLRERLSGFENRQTVLEAGVAGLLKPRYRVPAGTAQPSTLPASH